MNLNLYRCTYVVMQWIFLKSGEILPPTKENFSRAIKISQFDISGNKDYAVSSFKFQNISQSTLGLTKSYT